MKYGNVIVLLAKAKLDIIEFLISNAKSTHILIMTNLF